MSTGTAPAVRVIPQLMEAGGASGERSGPPDVFFNSVRTALGGAHVRGEDIMPTTQLAPSRASEINPNHHLWKNGRLWWLAVTLLHDGWRQERVRQSLGTDDVLEARRRRDLVLARFARPVTPVPARAAATEA